MMRCLLKKLSRSRVSHGTGCHTAWTAKALPTLSPRQFWDGRAPGTHKGPSTPNLTPCHYMLYTPAPTPVAPLPGGGAAGWSGGALVGARPHGAPFDAWLP